MPDKSPDAFRTISEVADWLGVQPHVLRFWESKFSQVRPVKRAGGRRYYRPNDMLLLGGIRKLLHEDGLTIKGAQKVLREEGMSHVARMSQPLDPESAALSELKDADDAPASAEPPEKETGQVVAFGSARQRAEPVTEPPAAPDTGARPEMSSGPDVTDAPSEPVPSAQGQPSPDGEVAPDSTPVPQAPAEPEGPAASALPSFMRNPATRQPSAPEEPPAKARGEGGTSDRLPSFLHPDSASGATQGSAGESTADPAKSPEPEAEPQAATASKPAPRPRKVDAPDPDESTIEASPGALCAVFSVDRLPPERSADLTPLVAQLAALRDRMAAAQAQ